MATEVGYTHGYSESAFSSQQSRTAETYAAFLLPHVQPNFRILDFGCGPGTITAGLAKYVPQGQVIGVDISPEAIAQARRNAAALPGGCPRNLGFFCIDVLQEPEDREIERVDAEKEPTSNGSSFINGEERPGALPTEWFKSFDVIYESTALVHLPTPTKAIVNLKQFLKPDTGLFATRDHDILSAVFSPDPTGELAKVGDILNKLAIAGGGHTASHQARDVPVWLAQAGLPQEKITISTDMVSYTTTEARAWWGVSMSGRFEGSDPIREGLIEKGILGEEECDRFRDLIIRWSKEDIGMYFCVMIQVLAPIQ